MGVSPSPLEVGYRDGTVPHPSNLNFYRNSVIWCILSRCFFKVCIPIFASHLCAGKWLEDDLRAQMMFVLIHGLDRIVKSTLGYNSSG